VLEKSYVKPRKVVLSGGFALKGKALRMGLGGQDAHPDFIERRTAQGLQRELFQAFLLVSPGIAGSAEGNIGAAIRITEMMRIAHHYGAMIVLCWWHTHKRSGMAVELGDIALGRVRPIAEIIRHEAQPVDTVSVVEAVYRNGAVFTPEFTREPNFQKGVARCRALEG